MGIQMHGAGGGGPPIITIQPDAGTSPIGNILTFTSTDGSVTITGDEATDTINFTTPDKGDVDGPASSTDNAVARFDGTTGKILQNSGVTIDDSNNVAIPSTATISNPGAGANSEKFGASAVAAGARSVAIGNSASSAGTESVAIGQAVTTSQLESVGIGYGTATTGARATGIGAYCTSSNASTIAIGNGATATRSGGIAIGGASYAATAGAGQIAIGQAAQAMADGSVVVGYSSFVANSAYTESIVIGAIVAATAANQLVIGSTVSSGTLNTYIGKGVTHATPAATTTIQATGGSGTNIAGGGLSIAGGKGTGNAAGGAISFQTSDAGASGTTLQSLTTKMTLDVNGKLGIGTASPSGLLDVNSDVVRIRTAKTPASATATGNQGDFCWDSSYLYICTATDTWRRVAHASW